MGKNIVVAAAVAVIDRVGSYSERAAVCPHDVLRKEGLGPAGHSVASLELATADGWDARRSCAGVVDLAVGDGVDVKRRLGDGAGRCMGADGVVAAAIAVVDGVSDHGECAAVRPHDVLRKERLAPPGHCVAALQLAAAKAGNAGRASARVVDLGVGYGVDVERRLGDRARCGVGAHGVVAAAVAVIHRIAADREGAAVCPHHILRQERLAQSRHRVAALELAAAHSRNAGGGRARVVNLAVGDGVDVERRPGDLEGVGAEGAVVVGVAAVGRRGRGCADVHIVGVGGRQRA